jgi:hypothetical protein
MMKHARRLFALMAALFVSGMLALPVGAQAPVVTAGVDRASVTTDEQVTLSVIVDATAGEPAQPVLPALDGFRLLGSTSGTQVSGANGVRTIQVIHQYVLRPLRAGRLVIGPITVRLGGVPYQTDPLSVVVSQGTGQPGSAGTGGSAPGGLGNLPSVMGGGMDPLALLDQLSSLAGKAPLAADGALSVIEAPKGLRGQDILVEASVDNANPFQGEQIVYTVRVYQAVNPSGPIDYSPPSFTGFWSKQQPEQKTYRTQAAGRNYRVSELRTVLFPTLAGRTQIDPARLTTTGSFFEPGVELASQPATVNVKALPAGAPPSFQGAVGQFQIQAAVDKNAVKVGDTVTQQVRISGLGNLETLADPQWPDSPAWRAFDSKAQTSATSQGGKLGGTRTYSRVLMPTAPGSAALPAIEFAYFDPASGGYHTVSTGALAVTVAPESAAVQANQASPASPASPGPGKAADTAAVNAAVALARPDIRPIQAVPASWQSGALPLPRQAWYWLLWGLPLLLLAGQHLVQRRQAALQANPALLRNRLARRHAHQALAAARKHPDQASRSAEEILTGYLAGKLNRPVAGLTRQALAELLLSQGIDPELAARTQNCLLASQAARYAPGDAGGAGGALLAETEAIVEDLEQQWDGGRS